MFVFGFRYVCASVMVNQKGRDKVVRLWSFYFVPNIPEVVYPDEIRSQVLVYTCVFTASKMLVPIVDIKK